MPNDKRNQNNQTNDEKGHMTVQEAGQMGGEKVSRERGREFYEQIGKQGGNRVSELVDEGKRAEERTDDSDR